MENRFHLAIPAGDLDKAIKFYCEVLGCERGNAEFKYPDAWADINFWGNELTLHATDPNHKIISERHNVVSHIYIVSFTSTFMIWISCM